MPFGFHNNSHNSKSDFNERESRLVFENRPGGNKSSKAEVKVERRDQDILSSRPTKREILKQLTESKNKLDANEREIANNLKIYNEKYGKRDTIVGIEYGKKEVYMTKLVNFPKKPDLAIKQIDRILNSNITYNDSVYQFSESDSFYPKGRKGQAPLLKKLRKLFVTRKELLKNYSKSNDNELIEHRTNLVEKSRRIEKMQKKVQEWKDSPYYHDIKSDLESVIGGIIKHPDYKAFYERDGKLDITYKRQNEQLLKSILAKDTNDFKSRNLLGENFTEDYKKNKEKFPFIYYEWLKIKGYTSESLKTRQANLNAKEKEMAANNIPVGGAMIDRLNVFMDDSINAPIKKAVGNFKNPLLADKDPNDSKYISDPQKRIEALNSFGDELRIAYKKMDRDDPDQRKFADKIYKQYINGELKENLELEKQKLRIHQISKNREGLDKEFTRKEFTKEGNRSLFMRLVVMRYLKAIQIADTPFKGGGDMGVLLNPKVRQMLITTIYRGGVALRDRNDKTGKYKDEVSNDYKWMISYLTQSQYYNRSLKEKFADREQIEFMIVARYANLAIASKEHLETKVIPKLEALGSTRRGKFYEHLKILIAEKAKETDPAKKAELQNKVDEELNKIQRFTSITVSENNAFKILEMEKAHIKEWEGLIKKVETLLKDPSEAEQKKDPDWMKKKQKAIRSFIDNEVKTGGNKKLYKYSNVKTLESLYKDMQLVNANYNTIDKNIKREDYLERIGIKPEAVFKAYQEYMAELIKSNPKAATEMNVKQWDNLIMTEGGTKKLIDLFRKILPPSTAYKGREDFLRVFSTLHGINPLETKPKISDDQAVALTIYNNLKMEVKLREAQDGKEGAAYTAAMAKINGMTFGEKATEYLKGVLDMTIGPGQTIANRVAGAAIILMLWKAGKSAWKGKTPTGKFLRIAFMAGAAELALKHITGEGLTDKLKLSGIANALGGTYESVLMDRAEKKEMNVTSAEHASALMELRDVPFAKVIEWYEATDANGTPLNKKDRKGKIPNQINIYNILPGRVGDNKEMKARKILKKTIENFFGYVGNKEDGKDSAWGHRVLKEVWVDSIKNKDFALKSAAFTSRGLPDYLIKRFRQNPKNVTWQTVLHAEIRQSEVEKLQKESIASKLKRTAIETSASLARWTDEQIVNKVGAGAKEFWDNVSMDYTPKVQKFLIEMGRSAGTNLTYYKNKAVLWYEGNKITLRRVAHEHWEIVAEGVKLPFKLIYGLDQMVVPWAATKLRQFTEIFKPDSESSIDHDLNLSDIFQRPDTPANKTKFNIQNKYFGYFRRPFMNAFESGEKGGDRLKENESDKIAYLITEVDQKLSDVNPKDTDYDDRYNKMKIKSAKEAVRIFGEHYKDMSEEKIRQHMYPIHVYSKTATRGERTPEKVYIFWRMPTEMSNEYKLKEDGSWTDYMNPNKFKDRAPFMVRPDQGLWENIKRATGLDNPSLRSGAQKAVSYTIAQALRFYLGMAKTVGNVGAEIATIAPKVGDKEVKWFRELTSADEKTLQALDEYLYTARDPALAMSDFYKIPANAKVYAQELERATDAREPMNLVDPKDKNGNLLTTKDPKGNSIWNSYTYDTYNKQGKKEQNRDNKRLNPEHFSGA